MTRMRLTVALLAAAVLVAGCGPSRDDAASPKPAASSASTPAPSVTASDVAHSLTELARQPCRALSPEDNHELFVVLDGQETDLGGKRACQWGAMGGLVSFTPYPSTDRTTSPQFRHLTPRKIGGHRAKVGVFERTDGCVMVVAVGTSRSFEILVVPFGEGAPGPDVRTVATNFATAIVRHLR